MCRKLILLFSILMVLSLSPSFADVRHANGYSLIETGKQTKLAADDVLIKKFTKAFGGKLDSYVDRKATPNFLN